MENEKIKTFLGLDRPFDQEGFNIPSLDEGSTPFIFDINEKLKAAFLENEITLPNLSKFETIAIFSDYGGEDKTSKFTSYSYFVTSFEFVQILAQEFEKVRKLNDVKKEFAYKHLADGPVARSIPMILDLTGRCPGLIFTHLVDKKIHTLAENLDRDSLKKQHSFFKEHGIQHWEPAILEKALRILNHVTYLFALFGKDSSKTFWMTDHDSICSNELQTDILGQSYQRMLSHYSKNKKFERIGIARPFPGLENLLSIPDLIAGCTASVATQHYSGQELALRNSKLPALDILKLMANRNAHIARFNVIHKIEDGELTCAGFRLDPGPGY